MTLDVSTVTLQGTFTMTQIPNTPGADSLSPSNLCSRDVITVPALQQASPESKQETEKSAQAVVVQGNHFGQCSSRAS